MAIDETGGDVADRKRRPSPDSFRRAVESAVTDWLERTQPGVPHHAERVEAEIEAAIAGWLRSEGGRGLLAEAVRSAVEEAATTWVHQNRDALLRAVQDGSAWRSLLRTTT